MRFLDRLLRRDGYYAQIESIEVDPPTALLGEPCTITVVTSQTGPRSTVTGVLYGPGGEALRLRFARVGESVFQQEWRAETTIDAGAGRWRAGVRVEDDTAETAFDVTDRAETVETRIRDFTVQPEPAEPGEPLSFGGRLERSAGRDEWTGLPDGQLILLSFRAEDEFAWRVITETKTGEGGFFAATATAVESGLWRAEFPGTAAFLAFRGPEVASTAPHTEGDVKLTHGRNPAKVRRGKTVRHGGTVHFWSGTSWRKLGSGRAVTLQVNGANQAGDTTDRNGGYTIKERAQASGGRRAIFRKQDSYNAGRSDPERKVTVTN